MRDDLKYFFAGLIIVLFARPLHAQNQTAKWYFGTQAALDFMSSPPNIITSSAMGTPAGFTEGVSSIADAAGNLLFYTDGNTVWNQSNAIMANGTGLMGSYTSAQAAIIIKQPGNSNIYFIFTTQSAIQSATVGLRYTTVDMSLAAGMGSVTVKNTLLYQSSTERICATRHCNGSDIWVLSHEYPGSNFYAHLVTASGISGTPVISSIGFDVLTVNQGQATMKLSPTGKKIIAGCYIAGFELYDFDNTTGVVSNSVSLGGRNASNVEFSPNGSKCYGTSADTLKQWNVCAGSAAAIKASVYKLKIPVALGHLQLAPDGKIYAARPFQQMLGVINSPNITGAGCNYVDQGQSIAPNTCSYGLPQFMSSYLIRLPAFSYSFNPVAAGCLTSYFSFVASNTVCVQAGYSIASLSWSFGDPSSGTANTSTLVSPSHAYTATGIYTVQLVLYNACGGVLDTLRQRVNIGTVAILSSGAFSICAGRSLTLTANGASSYTWSTGTTGNSIVISPAVSAVITVTANSTAGCPASGTQSITVVPQPTLAISGPTNVCGGLATILTASGAQTYTWSNGSNTATMSPGTAGNYTVTGNNASGCLSSQTISIGNSATPTISIAGNSVVCAGAAITLTASGALNYTWSPGALTSTVSLNPQQSATYTVYGIDAGGCGNTQTVGITVSPGPTLSIAGTSVACGGAVITQTASGALSYTWSTGALTDTVNLSPAQTTAYSISGTGSNGCVGTASVLITLATVSANSSDICSGQTATLTASSPVAGFSYTWLPVNDNNSSIYVSPAATQIYTLTASQPGCTTSINSTVSVAAYSQAVTGFSYLSPVCQGSLQLLPDTAKGFTPLGSFTGDAGITADTSSGLIDLSQQAPGSYTITYSIMGAGCLASGSSSFNLVITAPPQLSISPDLTIVPGASVSLLVSGGSNYLWDPAMALSCIHCDNPVAAPLQDTRYCASTNAANGCSARACVHVIVSCEGSNGFSVPNAFSPNNDGLNDEFCLEGWNNCVSDFNVMIFDRWGEKVFESKDPSFCWDGVYKGQPLNADVFVFVIRAQTKTKNIHKKGNITLVR